MKSNGDRNARLVDSRSPSFGFCLLSIVLCVTVISRKEHIILECVDRTGVGNQRDTITVSIVWIQIYVYNYICVQTSGTYYTGDRFFVVVVTARRPSRKPSTRVRVTVSLSLLLFFSYEGLERFLRYGEQTLWQFSDSRACLVSFGTLSSRDDGIVTFELVASESFSFYCNFQIDKLKKAKLRGSSYG